ncbi:hypothetical protein EXS70_03350 [Candidatus Peribacteria bacterium]|nr:hypothetical protein [Candidatus Peribacteria bacterium]
MEKDSKDENLPALADLAMEIFTAFGGRNSGGLVTNAACIRKLLLVNGSLIVGDITGKLNVLDAQTSRVLRFLELRDTSHRLCN